MNTDDDDDQEIKTNAHNFQPAMCKGSHETTCNCIHHPHRLHRSGCQCRHTHTIRVQNNSLSTAFKGI